MAYPTVSAPYGFKPVNRLDGMPYAGAIRQIPIDAATQTDPIFNGDPVYIAVGGTVALSDMSTNPILGILVGCQYVNSMGQTVYGQNYPGAGAATNPVAYVVDDAYAVHKVAATDNAGVITPVGQEIVGTNVPGVAGTGNTLNGDSGASVDVTAADDTSTLPWRVVSGVAETVDENGDFTEVIVKINTSQWNNPTGNTLPA